MDNITVIYKVLFLSQEISFNYRINRLQLLIEFYLPDLSKESF